MRCVGDGAIARQRAGPELDSREASAQVTLASSSIHQHVGPLPCSIMVHPAFRPLLKKNYWNLLSRNSRNVSVLFEFHLPNGLRDISEHRERRPRSIAARWGACHLPRSTVVVNEAQYH